jgi:entry exclusion lipoprotein TrbK
MKRYLQVTAAALLAALVVACSPATPEGPSGKEMPVLNDENCKPENIAKIKDSAVREKFAQECLRRGTFKPSSGKKW